MKSFIIHEKASVGMAKHTDGITRGETNFVTAGRMIKSWAVKSRFVSDLARFSYNIRNQKIV